MVLYGIKSFNILYNLIKIFQDIFISLPKLQLEASLTITYFPNEPYTQVDRA